MTDELSTPRGAHRPSYNPEIFGQFAETFAHFLGTGRYLAIQTIIVLIWIAINAAVAVWRWDPYPFILLNLMFSTQAAYAAPLILLAQNRQVERDRIQSERDREVNALATEQMRFLAVQMRGIAISLEDKVDREDLRDALDRVLEALQRDVPPEPERERSLAVPRRSDEMVAVDGEDE
jgi:uncharacterized membrane protein